MSWYDLMILITTEEQSVPTGLFDQKKVKIDEKSPAPVVPSSSIVLTNRHDDGSYSSTIFEQKYDLEVSTVILHPVK
jgi:hypothetical protein